MVIIGLDPGTSRIGYGVIEKSGHNLKYLECGVFEIEGAAKGEKLQELEFSLNKIIGKYRPGLATVESLFFVKNKKTAIAVAEARGVILLSLSKKKIRTTEVTPKEAKLAVSGWGGSDKKAIKKAVCLVLRIKDIKVLDDATDALAIAIAGSLKENNLVSRNRPL
ncbi:MAG: crossover junction endodeoxyribonuclease RuvC [Patescibacteria group bacterium]|nr:crossover junction endodeoxyribonuclease RuvC [Patescibacteria group bacterium]